MSNTDEQENTDFEQPQDGEWIFGSTKSERLRNAYGGVEHVDEFHVGVEQDGKHSVVPSGCAIPLTTNIETVYVVFMDGIEYQHYTVELDADFGHSRNNTGQTTQRVHRLRQEGGSEWDEPWAVEAAFEERLDGWLIPTELRFEGLAKHATLSAISKRGIDGGPNILEDAV